MYTPTAVSDGRESHNKNLGANPKNLSKSSMQRLIVGGLFASGTLALEFSVVSEYSSLGPAGQPCCRRYEHLTLKYTTGSCSGRHGIAAASVWDVPYLFGGCNIQGRGQQHFVMRVEQRDLLIPACFNAN